MSLNFENQHIEYKRCLNDRFEPAVIAFLNSSGGILYVGIDDNLTVYGVKNPDVVQRQIADRIKNNIRGECLGLYDIVTETDVSGILYFFRPHRNSFLRRID